jgi:hypothetical protein
MMLVLQKRHGFFNLPIIRIPYPYTRIQTACRYFFPIKSNGVDLTEVACERTQTFAFRDAPNLCGCVVTAGYNEIAMYLKTADTGLVTDENVLANSLLEIPDP